MSLHTAEAVAAEVKARVERCTVAQGAETDLAQTVWEGRRRISDDMIPCVSIIEGEDRPDSKMRTEYEVGQHFVTFAYVPCDPAHPNRAAHAAIRDLKRAFFLTDGKADVTWGGKVRKVEYLGRDIGPRADGAAFVLASVEILVTFVERLHAP